MTTRVYSLFFVCFFLLGSYYSANTRPAKLENLQPENTERPCSAPENAHLVGSYSGEIILTGQKPLNFILVIEDVEGKSIEGYNIAAGNRRPVSGYYEINSKGSYILSLNEPGDKNDDGSFVIALDKAGSVYSGRGTWTGYKKGTKAKINLSSAM